MDYNLDIISSELKVLNEKLKHFLDQIEPVLRKENYQTEDIDFLKTIDFQVIEMEPFNKILWPLLETDDEGFLLKKSLIHNLIYSSLLQTKKRYDAIFSNDYQFDDEKINNYKTRFFELGYSVQFIDNFFDDLRKQRLWFILLFAYFTNHNELFDFNELVESANNVSDLTKRKKLYLDEYDRVNLLWIKNNNFFKRNIPLNPNETDVLEPYNEETDDDYQDTKRHYFDFLDKCQKAIESINFQIKNSSYDGVPVQEPKPPTIIDEIKEMVESSEFLNKNDNFNVNEIIKKFGINIYNEITSIIPHLEQFPESYSLEEKQKHEALLCDQSEIFNKSIKAIKNVFSDKDSLLVIDYRLLLYKTIRLILEKNGFSKGLAHYHSFFIFKLIIEDEASDLSSEINVSDLALIEDKEIEHMKLSNKLLNKILNLTTNIEFKSKRSDLYIETIELAKQLSKLNNQFPENTNVAEIVQNEIPSITTETLIADEQENPTFNISTSEIFESGFVRAFIEEYYEEKIHSYYPEKDKLLYIMCSSHIEKQEVTKKQIETIKSEIHKLGWEELSVGYLQSCKPESGPNFIEPGERFDFWLNIFSNKIQDNVETFCPVFDTLLRLNEDVECDESSSYNDADISHSDSDADFWEYSPKWLRPKNQDLSIEVIVKWEIDLIKQIEDDINNYNENGCWEFDFDEYERYIKSNRVLEDLFDICELFVQLNRFEMFQEFLLIPAPNETNKNDKKKTIQNKNEISLSDFLIKKSDLEKLKQIQKNFIHYEGKRMAILIYFLQVEYKIISTISNSRTHSRKQFIQLFKNDSSFNKFQAMNKYLNPYSGELNLSTNNDLDADYIDIKEKLKKIIENSVA